MYLPVIYAGEYKHSEVVIRGKLAQAASFLPVCRWWGSSAGHLLWQGLLF